MQYITDLSSLLMNLLFIAFLTEASVQVLKSLVIRFKMSALFIYTISIVVGIILAFALEVSLFTKENFFAYIVGVVICGLVASRGSNYVHNFLGNLPQK